jgi:CubicO group peptidase (beta-lactamase class C family)
LSGLRDFVIDSSNTTGMMVVYHGKILFEYGNVKDVSYVASCRKSILSLLFGPFVEGRKIDLNTTIQDLSLDDKGGLLPVEKQASIQNLLTARSGVYHPASNQGDDTNKAPRRGSVKPGEYWLYNNWDFNILGYILEQQTGRTIYELVDSILSKPLKMQDWNINIQRKTGDTIRSKYLAYHMWFSTRDMARIGYLMLRNGKWDDKVIIPSKWIKASTSVVTPLKEAQQNKTNYFDFGYGYLWWIWDSPDNTGPMEGAYTASGAFGQFITIIPKLDLVIAHKTNYDDYQRETPTETYLKIINKLVKAYKPLKK